MGYRNPIAKQIGLDVVPDPDTSNSSIVSFSVASLANSHIVFVLQSPFYVDTFFERFYTVECVLACVRKAITDRKLPYNSVVSYLQYHRPPMFSASNLQEEFLYHCFDAEGRLTEGALVWMLHQMGVLKLAENKSLEEKLLFPPLDEDTIRASRERLANSATNVPLNVSQVIELDEIRRSVESAEQHKCDLGCDH